MGGKKTSLGGVFFFFFKPHVSDNGHLQAPQPPRLSLHLFEMCELGFRPDVCHSPGNASQQTERQVFQEKDYISMQAFCRLNTPSGGEENLDVASDWPVYSSSLPLGMIQTSKNLYSLGPEPH